MNFTSQNLLWTSNTNYSLKWFRPGNTWTIETAFSSAVSSFYEPKRGMSNDLKRDREMTNKKGVASYSVNDLDWFSSITKFIRFGFRTTKITSFTLFCFLKQTTQLTICWLKKFFAPWSPPPILGPLCPKVAHITALGACLQQSKTLHPFQNQWVGNV
jgi:hypothetical protein